MLQRTQLTARVFAPQRFGLPVGADAPSRLIRLIMGKTMEKPLWQPSAERIAAANLTRFMADVDQRWGSGAHSYEALHRWSVAKPDQFWTSIWDFCGVIGERGA